MTITLKPKKAPEPAAPKPRVLARPPKEIVDELRGAPAAPTAADRKPYFPEDYKVELLAKMRGPDYDWLLTSLRPELPDVNEKMLRERIEGMEFTCTRFVGFGYADGIHALKGGYDDVGTWLYADLATAAIASDPKSKPAKGKKGKTPSLPAAGKAELHLDQAATTLDEHLDPPKSKTKKATAPTNGQAAVEAARELMKYRERNVKLQLTNLQRHPINREPAKADVEARAASLQADGQLENITVRYMGEGHPYQIISGETRSLAAQSIGWFILVGDIIECDDATAAHLVGLFNGQRKDLNPIEKARHIEELCKLGKTREEAGRSVGYESGSAASNLVRLLKLPKAWQERIASGELQETFARVISGYAHIPMLIEELDLVWEDNWEYHDWFESRDALEEMIGRSLPQCTRPLDSRTHHYAAHELAKGSDAKTTTAPSGDYKSLITTEELAKNRDKLGITKVLMKERIKGKLVSTEIEVATNVELYDKLQIPHINALHATTGKVKAKAVGAEAKPAEKTPAQKKQAAADRARQLERSIAEWYRGIWRHEIAAAIAKVKPTAKIDQRLLNLLLAWIARPQAIDHCSQELIIGKAIGAKLKPWDSTYTPVAKAGLQAEKWQLIVINVCADLVGSTANLDDDELLALMDDWGCSMTAAWERLYRAKDPLIAEFFEMHRKDELAALATELHGIKFADNYSKPLMIEQLLTYSTAPLKLPKSLTPAKKRGGK